ncbi:hypothetical protein [Mesorhizobium sp. ES1-4]|uniref:hypothetical protein n=1 Tax=Mesorhizobium sp. ES1-4 TaxID=2876627 RepID=UPI001CCC6086|nr:hypothetical protein [Mesorhizobium sp. ES1-4]MBZ9798193.1 hypothetical protein [Mesorhizobium sp. ES1-4]
MLAVIALFVSLRATTTPALPRPWCSPWRCFSSPIKATHVFSSPIKATHVAGQPPMHVAQSDLGFGGDDMHKTRQARRLNPFRRDAL